MLIKTRGIVFRTIKYSETSLITDIYTEEKGLQRYIINGVRSKKAKVRASLLQVMSLLDLVAYHREGRDLHRIKEVRPAVVYQSIPFSVRKGAVGLFMAEVARKTIRETEEQRALFNFLFETFRFLDATNESVANLHLNFLLHLAAHLGFTPGGDCDQETPFFDLQEGVFVSQVPTHPYSLDEEHSRLLYQLLCTTPTETHTIRITPIHRRALLENLLNFYRLHIDNFPPINAHLVLQEVLE